mmetsp:Transcript_13501/g.25751  ORF Transcript_13501/g.25751 Transcript_13501/m.25751 type:complete len:203 (-) Transcript_13501:65-673(-)
MLTFIHGYDLDRIIVFATIGSQQVIEIVVQTLVLLLHWLGSDFLGLVILIVVVIIVVMDAMAKDDFFLLRVVFLRHDFGNIVFFFGAFRSKQVIQTLVVDNIFMPILWGSHFGSRRRGGFRRYSLLRSFGHSTWLGSIRCGWHLALMPCRSLYPGSWGRRTGTTRYEMSRRRRPTRDCRWCRSSSSSSSIINRKDFERKLHV